MDLSNFKKLQNSLDVIANEHKDISVIVNNAGKTHDNFERCSYELCCFIILYNNLWNVRLKRSTTGHFLKL